MKNRRCESKKVTLKIALNLDLTLSDDGECLALLISSGIIDLGAFCVELWSFFVSKRISIPMSSISFLEHSLLLCCTSPELRSASSYGRNKFCIKCWPQCHLDRPRTSQNAPRRSSVATEGASKAHRQS